MYQTPGWEENTGMHAVIVAIVIIWAVFWIYWLLSAIAAKPSQSRGAWRRGAPVRIVLLVTWVVFVRLTGLKPHGVSDTPWLIALGFALFLAGLALAVWARLYIGRNWGTPMSQKTDSELVTTGPYRRVRHPIYTGILLGMVGTALATTLWGLIVVGLLAVFFAYSAFTEERNLAATFPDAYPAYKAATKMLIPFVF
jgi:protein-S-isoprenylcysteine O-methyltransferase Ste14